MSNYYLEVLDDCLMDLDISNALFTESNTADFLRTIKNTFNELQIKVKEYAIMQDSKLKDKDGNLISKYQKGIDDKVDYLLSLKSKNITSVDCYDYSKIRRVFPNMLDSLSNCIDATLLKDFKSVKDIDSAYDTFDAMLSDFSDLLDKYSNETRLNVDTCIKILRDSMDDSGSTKNLSIMFSTINKLEHKISSLKLDDSEVDKHQFYCIKKAISHFGKFAIRWIKILDKNYDIEFSR